MNRSHRIKRDILVLARGEKATGAKKRGCGFETATPFEEVSP
jgi:hypothetical protein